MMCTSIVRYHFRGWKHSFPPIECVLGSGSGPLRLHRPIGIRGGYVSGASFRRNYPFALGTVGFSSNGTHPIFLADASGWATIEPPRSRDNFEFRPPCRQFYVHVKSCSAPGDFYDVVRWSFARCCITIHEFRVGGRSSSISIREHSTGPSVEIFAPVGDDSPSLGTLAKIREVTLSFGVTYALRPRGSQSGKQSPHSGIVPQSAIPFMEPINWEWPMEVPGGENRRHVSFQDLRIVNYCNACVPEFATGNFLGAFLMGG